MAYRSIPDDSIASSTEEPATDRRRTVAMRMAVVVGALCVGVAAARQARGTESAGLRASQLAASAAQTPGDSYWEYYKYTVPISDGTWPSVAEKVNNILVPVIQTVNLGCESEKVVGFTMGATATEIHWVDAERFRSGSMNMSLWMQYFEELNGDMKKFNGFMHNKAQLYVPGVSKFLPYLDKENVPYMKRRSDIEGGVVAHVSFDIGGHIYELVGPADDEAKTWPEWTTAECPEAHRLTGGTLDNYTSWYWANYGTDYTNVTKWMDESGRLVPLMVQVGIATADFTQLDPMLGDLERVMGASVVESTSEDGGCSIYRIQVNGRTGFQPAVNYVKNQHYQEVKSTYSISEYENAIGEAHRDLTGADPAKWALWDHWLDQHIGWYHPSADGGDDDETTCDDKDRELATRLSSSGVPVAQRTAAGSDGLHYYTGYAGSMTWEYNIGGCEDNSRNDRAHLCGCINANNNLIWESAHDSYDDSNGC